MSNMTIVFVISTLNNEQKKKKKKKKSEFTLYSSLNVKELLARNRPDI